MLPHDGSILQLMQMSSQAYVCRGAQGDVPEILKRLERSDAGDVDLLVRVHTNFGIDEAREVRERSSLRGVGQQRVFVIVATALTLEAQNALLKTFEEPPAGAVFVLVVPSPETLLPTLRSRVQVLELDAQQAASPVNPHEFMQALPAARLDMLKPFTNADERDTTGTLAFLVQIEQLVNKAELDSVAKQESVRAIYLARKHVLDTGALRKPLLEQLALIAVQM